MIFNILTKIIIIATITVIITMCVLIWCAIDDYKRKKIYGIHYNEDHFREYESNDCLASKEEIESLNLPEYIRYKGVDILSKKEAYIEGTRLEDRVIIIDEDSVYEYEVISRKSIKHSKEEILSFKNNFTDCKAIVKIKMKENIYFLYCI